MVPQFTLALTSFMILSIFKLIEAILKIIFVYIKNLISHYGSHHEPLKYHFSHSAIWLILNSQSLITIFMNAKIVWWNIINI